MNIPNLKEAKKRTNKEVETNYYETKYQNTVNNKTTPKK